tara:strand:+ start:39 stop:503 length:465 start_codon:yes stop_codon:yes gene_type:complete
MEVVGYNNYLIYEDGKVQNKKSKRYLKPCDDGAGYLQLNLYKEGKKKLHKIHRLVGLHYIPNPDNKICLDHINRNRSDNRIDNLRWASESENQQNRGTSKNNKLEIKNISKHSQASGYTYEKKINGERHTKYFLTLEEAIEYKKEYENKNSLNK